MTAADDARPYSTGLADGIDFAVQSILPILNFGDGMSDDDKLDHIDIVVQALREHVTYARPRSDFPPPR